MANIIGNLAANLIAQTGSFNTDLQKARKQLGGFEKTTNQALAKVDRQWREFRRSAGRSIKSMFSLRNAAVSLAGAGGIGLVVKNSLTAAANLQDLASRAGVTTDALQELSFAAQQYGVQQDVLVDGLRELQVRASEFADDGGGPAADSFERLGINAQEAQRLVSQADNGFREIVNRIRELDSAAAQARAFDELFGGEAGERIRQITGDIGTLTRRARELGLVIDEEMIRKSDQARDRFQTLSSVISKRVTAAVADLAPALDNLFKGIIKQLPGVISDIELFAKRLGVISEVSDRTKLRELREEAGKLRRELELSQQGIIQGAGRALQSLGDQSRDVAKELRQTTRQIGILTGDIDPLGRLYTPGEIDRGGTAGGTGGNTGGGTGDTPETGASTGGPLSFGGVDFNDRFTTNDAIKETIALHKEANQQLTEKAMRYARLESEGRKVRDAHAEIKRVAEDMANRTFDRVGNAITDAFVRGEGAMISFKSVARGVLSEVTQMFIRLAAINPLKNALGLGGGDNATLSSAISALGNVNISGMFGGGGGATFAGVGGVGGAVPMGRASGGPVGSGSAYRVGEQGPETFIPAMDGMVVPNGGFGGGPTINITQNISANGDKQVAQIARQASAEAVQQAAPAIVQQSVQQTGDRMRRNPKFGRRK